jgi:DNA-binding transcriptional MerR regulator
MKGTQAQAVSSADKYLIRDFEALSGIKAHTIRIWELRYGILKPKRSDTNIRRYNDDELKYLLNISLLNKNGFKISKLASMEKSEIDEKVKALTNSNFAYPVQINALIMAMVQLDEHSFERVLNVNIAQLGFEVSIEQIIFPFLEQIGVMWQTGSINPAQEHFITNLIRQKIIVHIDKLKQAPAGYVAKSLLFLPEDEFHEITLLYLDYHLKKHRHHVLYLGQNVPLKDVYAATEVFNPQNVFSIFTQRPTEKQMEKYTTDLAATLKKQTIYLTGYRTLHSKNVKQAKNIRILKDPLEIFQVITSQD